MKPRTALLAAVSIVLVAMSHSAAGQNPDELFGKANQEFAAGHFREAAAAYGAVVEAGRANATVYYNSGNAWFRSGDFARAILSYERALALEPHHPEAEANLRLARDEARALELPKTSYERYLVIGTTNQYTIMAAIAFWISVLTAAALIFSRRSRFGRTILLGLAVIAFAGGTFAVYASETGSKGIGLAIVTDKNTQARVATADNSKSVLALPAGSEINVLSTRGDWIYARLPNDLRGWIPAKSAEAVRM